MKKVYQQGQADGLCGLYSVLNFATLVEWRSEASRDAMEYVLEAAQAEGVLNPHWIKQGYRSNELKAILNRIFNHWWMHYEAYYQCEIKSIKGEDNYDLHHRVLMKGGAVISGASGHWVLLVQVDGQMKVLDSDNASQPIRRFDRRMKGICSDDSVIILRKDRPIIDIESLLEPSSTKA